MDNYNTYDESRQIFSIEYDELTNEEITKLIDEAFEALKDYEQNQQTKEIPL